MAIQNIELNKKVQELIKRVSAEDVYGKRIYLLGSAEFGPTNEPKLIKSTVGLYNTFGREGTLINAFHALKYTSKNNEVYLVKVTGEHAMAYLNFNVEEGEIFQNAVYFIAKDSNEVYNDIVIQVDKDKIEIHYPEILGGHKLSYLYSDYRTLEELSNAINKVAKNGNGLLYMYYNIDGYYGIENGFYCCNMPEIYFYGGRCGLNYTKNMLYNCLEKTYSVLESEEIDIVIPIDAFIDDVKPFDQQSNEYGEAWYQEQGKDYLTITPYGKLLSYMDQLIKFCITQNNSGIVTLGVMGFNDTHLEWSNFLKESDELVQRYIECMKYNLSCCDYKEYAFLVSVVAGDILYNHGSITMNGYLAFAAAMASYKYSDGITNKPISQAISLHNEFTGEAMDELRKFGINCFRQSVYYNQPVIYDAVTSYPKNNGFKNLVNVRMINVSITYINELFGLYIGENMVQLIREQIIDTDLNSLLKSLVSTGIITGYEFTVVPNYLLRTIKIYLKFQTIYTVKFITLCSVVNIDFVEED